MRLKFPTFFSITYPEENKNYYLDSIKPIMQNLLLSASDYYCMYCGKSLKIDGNITCNLEHSIEKSNQSEGINFLEHCKFNLSVSCISCNQKYKKRMISPIDVLQNPLCKSKKCPNQCSEFIQTMVKYFSKNSIILQPLGVINKFTKEKYEIEYDLLKHIFEPALNTKYTQEDKRFISEHISRFHLNKDMNTDIVIDICEEIFKNIEITKENLDSKIILNLVEKQRYENVLGKIFINFLKNNFSTKSIIELKKFCQLIIICRYL